METPSRSLAGMTSSLLGKQLPKDPAIRLSRWSASLKDEQVIFLWWCLYCFVGYLVSCSICSNYACDVLLMPSSVTP